MTNPADDKGQTPESRIAQAIRSKREKHTSLPADLEALEASLLADIEAFDLRALNLGSEAPAAGAAASAEASANVFPEIVAEGTARSLPNKDSALDSTAPDKASSVLTTAAPAPGLSLLQQLRQQAQAKQSDAAAKQRELTAISKQLDECLRRIFSYCHDLVQQLNVLKPTVEHRYSLLGSIEFAGLEWQEGFADYRVQPHSSGSGDTYEQVTLSCRLQAPDKLSIERDAISADKFRKALFDHGIAFTCDEVKNARHMLLKATFSITAEVKVNLRWRGDAERGVIVLESRNFERFGSRDYIFAPESVNMAMLDQFALLLLGQPNQFRNYYRR